MIIMWILNANYPLKQIIDKEISSLHAKIHLTNKHWRDDKLPLVAKLFNIVRKDVRY
jgi:hypothetical protein